jgi:hypothetical protein
MAWVAPTREILAAKHTDRPPLGGVSEHVGRDEE